MPLKKYMKRLFKCKSRKKAQDLREPITPRKKKRKNVPPQRRRKRLKWWGWKLLIMKKMDDLNYPETENGNHEPLWRKRPEHQWPIVEDVHVGGVGGEWVALPRSPSDGGRWGALRQARQHHASPRGEHHSCWGRDGEARTPSSATANSWRQQRNVVSGCLLLLLL